MGQPIGLDLAIAFRIAEMEDADLKVMAALLPAFESGMIAGISNR